MAWICGRDIMWPGMYGLDSLAFLSALQLVDQARRETGGGSTGRAGEVDGHGRSNGRAGWRPGDRAGEWASRRAGGRVGDRVSGASE